MADSGESPRPPHRRTAEQELPQSILPLSSGYGLKFTDRFTHTHLGEIGQDRQATTAG